MISAYDFLFFYYLYPYFSLLLKNKFINVGGVNEF